MRGSNLLPKKMFPLAIGVVALTLGLTLILGVQLLNLRDRDLAEKSRDGVGAQDDPGALLLLTEVEGKKTGLLVQEPQVSCDEVIDLPPGITDWRFSGAARQAYITMAKDRQMKAGTCGCLFGGYSFDAFTAEMLSKAPDALVDSDRPALESYLDSHQRDVESRYRAFEAACRAN